MVVKAMKRKSMNGSGLWEVEEISVSTKTAEGKKQKMNESSEPESNSAERSSSSPSKPSFSPQKNENKERENFSPKQENKNVMNFKQKGPQEQQTQVEDSHSWPPSDLLQLVVKVEENSQNMLDEEYEVGINKIDWNEVAFGNHTAQACEKTWKSLFARSRTTRVLVDEVRELLLSKKLVKKQEPPSASGNASDEKQDDDDDEDNENEVEQGEENSNDEGNEEEEDEDGDSSDGDDDGDGGDDDGDDDEN